MKDYYNILQRQICPSDVILFPLFYPLKKKKEKKKEQKKIISDDTSTPFCKRLEGKMHFIVHETSAVGRSGTYYEIISLCLLGEENVFLVIILCRFLTYILPNDNMPFEMRNYYYF